MNKRSRWIRKLGILVGFLCGFSATTEASRIQADVTVSLLKPDVLGHASNLRVLHGGTRKPIKKVRKNSGSVLKTNARNLILKAPCEYTKKMPTHIPPFPGHKSRINANIYEDSFGVTLTDVERPKRPVIPMRADKKTEIFSKNVVDFVNASEDLAGYESILRKECARKNEVEAISLINELCNDFAPKLFEKNGEIISLDLDNSPEIMLLDSPTEVMTLYSTSQYIIERLWEHWNYAKMCCYEHRWKECLRVLEKISRRSPEIYGDGAIKSDKAVWFFKLHFENEYSNLYF